MFDALGNDSSSLEAALIHAEALVRVGRPTEALDVITTAERAANADAAFSLPRTCLQRGRAYFALERLDEATEMVSTGLLAAEEQGLPYEEALLLRVRGRIDRRLGDEGSARVAFARADELLARLGVRPPAHPRAPDDQPLPNRASP